LKKLCYQQIQTMGNVVKKSKACSSTEDEIIRTYSEKRTEFKQLSNLKEGSQAIPLYEVLLLGFGGVGKSCLLNRVTRDLFTQHYTPSLGHEETTNIRIVKDVSNNGNETLVHTRFTEFPGNSLQRPHLRKSLQDVISSKDGIIVVLDSTKALSDVLEELKDLSSMIESSRNPEICLLVAVTKIDKVKEQRLSLDSLQDFLNMEEMGVMSSPDIRLIETSSLYAINVRALFQNIAQMCHNAHVSGGKALYNYWENPIVAEDALLSWGMSPNITSLINRNPTVLSWKSFENSMVVDSYPTGSIRSRVSSTPIWLQMLSVERQEELYQSVQAMMTKQPAGSDMRELAAHIQHRFQLQDTQCEDIINYCRLEVSPRLNEEHEIYRRRYDREVSNISIDESAMKESGVSKSNPRVRIRSTSEASGASIKHVDTAYSDVLPQSYRMSLESIEQSWRSLRRLSQSATSMLGEMEGIKGPESLEKVEEFLKHYQRKMIEAEHRKDFEQATIFQYYVNKMKLRLSETKSRKDRLTKVWNRNAFDEDLPIFELMCQASSKDEEDFKGVVIAIDLMNFKLLNDKHGHLQGDRALRRFARELRKVAIEIAKETGYIWNVYRVGGDEFALLGRTNSRSIFKKVCHMCAAIKVQWSKLVPHCNSPACSFGRVGGVYGKHARYADADILERCLKEKCIMDRKTLADPAKMQTVLLYYTDEDDREEVITWHEQAIQEAMGKRDFLRCSKLQNYTIFLRTGFKTLQKEKNMDEENIYFTGDSTVFNSNPFRKELKRTPLREVFPNLMKPQSAISKNKTKPGKVTKSSASPIATSSIDEEELEWEGKVKAGAESRPECSYFSPHKKRRTLHSRRQSTSFIKSTSNTVSLGSKEKMPIVLGQSASSATGSEYEELDVDVELLR